MSDDLPSAIPEKSGDDKGTTNATSNEHGGKPEKQLKPTQTRKGKKSGLTTREIFECGSTPFVLWMWAELVRCHDILILCILGAAITVLQAAPCHFIYKLLKKFHWSFRLAFTIWVVLMILTWGVVLKNCRPVKPSLELAVTTSHASGKILVLNNNSLLQKGMFATFSDAAPILAIPLFWNESAVILQFEIANVGSLDSPAIEDPEVVISFPKSAAFKMTNGWEEIFPPPVVNMDECRQFRWKPSNKTMFPRDAAETLPPIELSTLPRYVSSKGDNRIPILLTLRAKNVVPFGLRFWLVLALMPPGDTNILVPQLVSGQQAIKQPNGLMMIPISTNK